MCSSLLQLAPGLRDLNHSEKKITVILIWANSQYENFVHTGQFWVWFL